MAFYHVSPSLHLFLSFSLWVALPTPPCSSDSVPACPLCLSSTLFLLYSSLTLTLQRVFALKSLLPFLPFSFPPSVSLTLSVSLSFFLSFSLRRKNHTLISLPALFLTSRLARRILTKLLSQLTPKAHNNLLCQQTHSRACVCVCAHSHTNIRAAHAHKHLQENTHIYCHTAVGSA